MRSSVKVDAVEEVGKGDVEPDRYPHEVIEGRVALRMLDLVEVGSIHPDHERESRLGDPLVFAQSDNPASEVATDVLK